MLPGYALAHTDIHTKYKQKLWLEAHHWKMYRFSRALTFSRGLTLGKKKTPMWSHREMVAPISAKRASVPVCGEC